MSNRKRIPERSHLAPRQRQGRGRHREASRTMGDLVAVPGQAGVRLLAAGALGSAALMALPALATTATSVTVAPNSPSTATLARDLITVSPNPPALPGTNGTISANACAIGLCAGYQTSKGADGSTEVQGSAGAGVGFGVAVQTTSEEPSPPGLHAGGVFSASADAPTFLGNFGGSFEIKADLAPLMTGGGSGSSITGTMTLPGVATLATWFGYPNFQSANGIGITFNQDAEGNNGFTIFPTLSVGAEAAARLSIFSGVSTAGTGSSETGGTAAATPASDPFAGLTANSPLTFAEMTYIPPPSAGFPDPATATPSLPSVLPSTGGPTLQQLMSVPMTTSSTATWPDGTPAVSPAAPSAAPASPTAVSPPAAVSPPPAVPPPPVQQDVVPPAPVQQDGVPPATDPPVPTTQTANNTSSQPMVSPTDATNQNPPQVVLAGGYSSPSVG
jgi:hypothetical protein